VTSGASVLATKATPWKSWFPELGAAFLSADLDLTPEVREDHASYLDHWLKVLKQDKRAIFSAASQAQRAARLNGLQLQKEARAA
jgi:antirestriction protein ArdC